MEEVNLRIDRLRCQVLERRRHGLWLPPSLLAPQTEATPPHFQPLITLTYATFSFYMRSQWGVAMCFSFFGGMQTHENKATNYSAANGNYMCIFVCLFARRKTHITSSRFPHKYQICDGTLPQAIMWQHKFLCFFYERMYNHKRRNKQKKIQEKCFSVSFNYQY